MKRPILLVEDDEIDVKKVKRALDTMGKSAVLHTCRHGEAALNYLRALLASGGQPELPKCIILDLSMPRMGGLELLKSIKENKLLKSLPVVILSSSDNPGEVLECYRLGVSGFFTKPSNPASFENVVKLIADYWTESR